MLFRSLTNPLLGEFICQPKMKSVLDDDDENTYPRYFGGMALAFNLPNYEREDEYS